MAVNSLPVFSLRDFIHRPLEHQHRRADDEQGSGDFERAVRVGRGRFLLWLRALGNSEQSDAAPIRREALDRGYFDFVGNTGGDDGAGALGATIVCAAVCAGIGGGRLFSRCRVVPDVLVPATGTGAVHCAVSDRPACEQHDWGAAFRMDSGSRSLDALAELAMVVAGGGRARNYFWICDLFYFA